MWLPFKKSKKEETTKISSVERVKDLSSHGFSEQEILKILRDEGYSPKEAESAMRASLKERISSVSPSSPQPQPMTAEERKPGTLPEPDKTRIFSEEPMERKEKFGLDFPGQEEGSMQLKGLEFPELPGGLGTPSRQPETAGLEEDEDELPDIPALEQRPSKATFPRKTSNIEETVESIIEEKWDVFEKEMEHINKKFEDVTGRLSAIEATVNNMKGVKKGEVDEIKAGIESYRESISEISARMEAIENTMKESLTPMMQSLRSLSDLVKTLKKK